MVVGSRRPRGAGGCRWPRWSATGPAPGAGCSTGSGCTAAAPASGAASCEDNYAALIAAAHAQLQAPIGVLRNFRTVINEIVRLRAGY
jgi:hypothetical protein